MGGKSFCKTEYLRGQREPEALNPELRGLRTLGWSEDSSPSPWVGLGGWSPLPAPTDKSYSHEECWSAGAEFCMPCRGPCTPPRSLPQTPVVLEAAPGLLAPSVHGFHTDKHPYLSRAPGQGGSAWRGWEGRG